MQRDIVERSFEFASKIVAFIPLLRHTDEGRLIGKQLLRSGTSIGANVEEAESGSSKDDFIYKMNLALREARETHYWLRLIKKTNLAMAVQLDNLIKEADELRRILGAIVSSSRGRRKQKVLRG